MGRVTTVVSQVGFVADQHSMMRNDGRQIDFATVDDAYIVAATGKKRLPAGTVMYEITPGGKIAEADALGAPPAAEAIVGILVTDAVEGDRSAALSGYGVYVGGVIYGDLLPIPGQAAGLAGVGTGFHIIPYTDDRAS